MIGKKIEIDYIYSTKEKEYKSKIETYICTIIDKIKALMSFMKAI